MKHASLIDVLIDKAKTLPNKIAYTIFEPTTRDQETTTYAELFEEVKGLAAWLQGQNSAGQRCVLSLPPGLEYIKAFLACMLAGVVVIPAHAPDPKCLDRSIFRLLQIVRDANASLILTTHDIYPLVQPLAAQRNFLRLVSSNSLAQRLRGSSGSVERLQILKLPRLSQINAARTWLRPASHSGTLAFLQYTSGATTDPKGVMLTHGNLLANLRAITETFAVNQEWRCVSWLPLSHDMGLIGSVLTSLYVGMSADLMSPTTFLHEPGRWLELIAEAGGPVVSGGPNFAFDFCARRIQSEARRVLDLSHWDIAFVGSEPIRHDTLDRFTRVFATSGFKSASFLPCYGLAESSLLVAGKTMGADDRATLAVTTGSVEAGRAIPARADDPAASTLVSCGEIVSEHHLAIVNPDSHTPKAPGEVGEIWIAGPSVAAGYWNRPEQSEQTFRAGLQGFSGRYLRTGDLGFVAHGRLFVTGRIKDLIIVAGKKHHPQDIEETVHGSDVSLRAGCTAAFAVDGGASESLVIVQEVSARKKSADSEKIFASIREKVTSEHQITPAAIVLIHERTIPKTPSGKIQRSATRTLYQNNGLNIIARWSASSAKVA
jgi:acyl-CoA synthetase (AMP-forming)/AMP-acid ligase II